MVWPGFLGIWIYKTFKANTYLTLNKMPDKTESTLWFNLFNAH